MYAPNNIYAISKQVYSDNQYEYKNILVINAIPVGPLAAYTRCLQIGFNRVSAFRSRSVQQQQVYGLYNTAHELFTLDHLPDFFTFCLSHGYKLETNLTQMLNAEQQLNPVICYISYT
jgi:hypothetical protein